jgi:hypothetical protein
VTVSPPPTPTRRRKVAEDKDKPQLDVPPRSQVDLKERLESDFGGTGGVTSPLDSDDDAVNPLKQQDQFAVEGNDTSAYKGVSEEYRTYANDTEKPYPFEGVEADAVKLQTEDMYAVSKGVTREGEQTLGGGSNFETVTSHESGEDVQPEEVDRQKVYAEAQQEQDKATESSPTPVKAAAAKVSSGTTAKNS